MEKSKSPIIWKTSDRSTKQSEIWGMWVVIKHTWDSFGLIAFKVILRSFGALSNFRDLDLMIRDRRKHYEWL